jgi:hypothetical protein
MTANASPIRTALSGLLFALPFVTMNAIVANRIEPYFSLIRPGPHTSPREYVFLFVVLFLIPVGAFVAARPLLRKGADGTRRFYALNAVLAAFLLLAFVVLSGALGTEIYRCDVLGIPNCD